MEKNLLIELLEDGDKVSLYSPRFDGETYTEFEKFLLEYKDSYPKDVAQIVYRLDIIKRDGADDRHFRYEGTKRDRVMALPSHLETTSLRLYLLNVQSKILILGNGGLKNSATYQENELLNKCVQTLQKIDIVLKQMEKQEKERQKAAKLRIKQQKRKVKRLNGCCMLPALGFLCVITGIAMLVF